MRPASSSRRPAAGTAIAEQPPRDDGGESQPAQSRRAEDSASTQDQIGATDDGRADAESADRKPPRKRSRLWTAIVKVFAGIWSLIGNLLTGVYRKLTAVLVAVLIAVAQGQSSIDPRTWTVSLSQYLSVTRHNLPVDAGVIGAVVLLAFVSWRASKLQKQRDVDEATQRAAEAQRAQEKEKAKDIQRQAEASAKAQVAALIALATTQQYDPQPIRNLRSVDFGVMDFVDSYYIPRQTTDGDNADARAYNALSRLADLAHPRDAASRELGTDGSIGICVIGPHNSGKSRLVWEALTSPREGPSLTEGALSTWTFVVWPLSPADPFPAENLENKTRRFIIFLNKLEKYADNLNPSVISRLNGIRRDFEKANVPLIVIATCQQKTEKLTEKLPTLWDSLDKIELATITEGQAQDLATDLQRRGGHPHRFDPASPWPGSIVRGGVTNADYNDLPEDAKQVLRVLKLLASAGIGTDASRPYVTEKRVCAVADALFDMPRLHWRSAIDALSDPNKGLFVNWQLVPPSYERAIWALNDDVVECVNDYPHYPLAYDDKDLASDLMKIEDWPRLFQVFKDTRDAEAMVALAQAWSSSPLPRRRHPDPPTKGEYLALAADCFRTALDVQYRRDKESDPFNWARTESLLADALTDQYEWMELEQPLSPAKVLQEAATAYQEALTYFSKDLDLDSWIYLTTSLAYIFGEQANYMEPEAAVARLEEAEELGATAAEALTPDTEPDLAASVWTTQTSTYLSLARLATESKAVVELEDKAYASARRALSQPGSRSKQSLGAAQATLSWVIRRQASLKTGVERATLLNEVVKTLGEALDTVADDSDQSAETRTLAQIRLADALLQHARLVATTPEAGKELNEAKQRCEGLLNTALDPDSLARVQGVYAGVLARFSEPSQLTRNALLDKALNNCRAAYDTPNRQSAPVDWAEIRYTFAEVALQFARLEGTNERTSACDALAAALQFLEEAFDVYQDNAPAFFGERQQALDLRKSIEQYAHELNCSLTE